jgi:hypothetical protein
LLRIEDRTGPIPVEPSPYQAESPEHHVDPKDYRKLK